MGNMVLATPALSDAAVITASQASGALAPKNLQIMSPKTPYRIADASSAFVQVDFATAKSINLAALLCHTASSRAFVRVRAANLEADITSDPDYDSGNLPMRSHQSGYDAMWAATVADENYGALDKNHFIHWMGTLRSFRFWRFDIQDPSSAYIDIGRLYLSNAWQPSTNINFGSPEGITDPSRKARTASGDISSVDRPKYRTAEFSLSFTSEDEIYDNAFEIERLRGRTKDVLYIQNPNATNHLQRRTIYGTLESLQPITNSNFSIFEKSFRVEEIPS